MPTPKEWTFWSFVTNSGRVVAEEWDTALPFAAEQAFRNMIRNHRKIANHREWTCWRHPMDGPAGEAGLVELGFKADGKQYRVLCVFNGEKCIIVVCVCYHKQSVWSPTSAVETATERAKLISAEKARLNVIQIEDDL
jgi:Phage derived protein Gp49-like (DUF891)